MKRFLVLVFELTLYSSVLVFGYCLQSHHRHILLPTVSKCRSLILHSTQIDFEKRELFRNCEYIDTTSASWFRLSALGKQRFATSVYNILKSQSEAEPRYNINLLGYWKIRLCNDSIYRYWIKGMEVLYNFKGQIDDDDNFEKIIYFPTLVDYVCFTGSYSVIGDSNKESPIVDITYKSVIWNVFGKEWEMPYVWNELVGFSYIDNDLWIEAKDLEGEVTIDQERASTFSVLTKDYRLQNRRASTAAHDTDTLQQLGVMSGARFTITYANKQRFTRQKS